MTFLLFFLLAFAKTGLAQVPSPSSLALGNSGVAQKGLWGVAENPASFSESDKTLSFQAYGFSQTQLADLSRFGLDIGLKLKSTNLNLGLQYFSPPGYIVTGLHFGANRKLGDGLFAGIRVGILSGDYDEYGSDLIPTAQGGLIYEVTQSLSAGAHYIYVEQPALPLAEHVLRLGVKYKSSQKVSVLLSAWQPVGQELAGGLGVSYQAADRLAFRAGIRTGAVAFSFGAEATVLKDFQVAVTLAAYQDLPVGGGYGFFY